MIKKTIFAALAVLSSAAVANAADLTPPPEPVSDWVFEVAPYGWLAGLKGNVAQFGLPDISVDASISDVLDNLDIALMGLAQVRNGRFSAFSDLVYAKLSADAETPHGIIANKVDVTTKSLMFTAAAAYSIYYDDSANFDLVAGGRLWSVNTDVELKGGLLDGKDFSDGETWVDPLVGAKGRVSLSPDIFLTGWGLIGGFDVNNDKLMWDLFGGLGYRLSDWASVVAGYRGVSVDYSNNGFVYDVVQQGPLVGFDMRF